MKLREVARAFGAMAAYAIARTSIERAAEWEAIEAELVAVTGSREEALRMARCAVEAAKAGVRSPEELAGLIQRAHVGDLTRCRDLDGIRLRLGALTRYVDTRLEEARDDL